MDPVDCVRNVPTKTEATLIVNSISKLAKLIEEDSVPGWVRLQVEALKPAIIAALEAGESYELHGPKGEVITIAPVKSS